MHTHVTGLDHAVIAVRDLASAIDTFRRLGFALTPTGHHAEWGTVNACAMFAQDYLELLCVEGPGDVADAVRAFTGDREGMMSLSLATNDGAAAALEMRARGIDVADPRSLSRKLDDAAETTLMFSEIALPASATPGIPARLVQHITAERERHSEWLDHPNGAIGIASITAIVDEPGELIPAWDLVFGPYSATPTDNTVTIHTGRGLIFLSRPDDLTQLHPEAELDEAPAPPALVALALQVADTDRAAGVLKANGIHFTRDAEGTIRIPPSEACGVFLEMVGA